ncbi:YfhO family protein [Flavobacterium psychrotolerans]|uniref:YfhO family protein n=1 Tax=Flavobacterium psychrotolerans TaxID=2169410 RepID=A0A2U1JKZ6_9FLAO|nr:YfhO family protein [Flavobacterium psychrotolerans]PWA05837.1 hypothetical protein DB895_05270 [Flavobacterium psychrotolerans]
MKILDKFYPHVLALVGFVLISLIYFYPVLQGKKIFQSDIVQYTGMAKEQNDFRAVENTEPYWTNSAFGGMPTYQLGANYPHEYISKLDHILRFLPRPADYLFLYFLGFYGLLLVLKIDPLKAFLGALAFGLSTYLIVILGVGHNAKAHAIAYMPLVIAGVILVFRKRFILGGILTMVAASLEINANHFQMTYYLLILILIFSCYFSYKFIKQKDYKNLLFAFGIFGIAGILAIGVNATNLLATKEYADFSTRGKSELTFNPDGSKKVNDNALSRDYITEYSYGIAESFNLLTPRLFGGSNNENIGTESKMYEFMVSQSVPEDQAKNFVSGMPTYWGDQPIVAAPAYIGAVVFFLVILALFIDKRKIKYAFLAGAIVSLLLSWGKNFPILTDFLIDFMPMYNKFRAVSSIQVLLELCVPVLAIMGLHSFFKSDKETQWKALWQSGAVGLGIIVFLFLIKGSFSFSGSSDSYFMESYGPDFVDALKADRRSLYSADLLRSGFFILVSAGILWLFIKNKLAQNTAIILVGFLMVFDLFFIDKNYVSGKDFLNASEVDVPFHETPSDAKILQDTTNYRVFEVSGNLSSSRASYFHKSIGGYHAAKPRRMQQLFDYQIAKNNMAVLDMLNVKYIIQTDKEGKEFPIQNPENNGNAWFVSQVKFVQTADEEMKALDHLDPKNSAVINQKEFGEFIAEKSFVKDSLATIVLQKYKPNYLKYRSNNPQKGLALFSEMYYKNGWNAFIDGKKVPHFRANYALRALNIPAGKHVIEFKFEPEVVKTGSTIALYSSIGMLFLIVCGLYFERKKKWYDIKKH